MKNIKKLALALTLTVLASVTFAADEFCFTFLPDDNLEPTFVTVRKLPNNIVYFEYSSLPELDSEYETKKYVVYTEGAKDYLMKEILEQPEVLSRDFLKLDLTKINKIVKYDPERIDALDVLLELRDANDSIIAYAVHGFMGIHYCSKPN